MQEPKDEILPFDLAGVQPKNYFGQGLSLPLAGKATPQRSIRLAIE
jgi:hypothetical protein